MHNSDCAEYLYMKAWYELHAKKGMIVTPSWCAQYTTALEQMHECYLSVFLPLIVL